MQQPAVRELEQPKPPLVAGETRAPEGSSVDKDHDARDNRLPLPLPVPRWVIAPATWRDTNCLQFDRPAHGSPVCSYSRTVTDDNAERASGSHQPSACRHRESSGPRIMRSAGRMGYNAGRGSFVKPTFGAVDSRRGRITCPRRRERGGEINCQGHRALYFSRHGG
jgi:hypothetical protein